MLDAWGLDPFRVATRGGGGRPPFPLTQPPRQRMTRVVPAERHERLADATGDARSLHREHAAQRTGSSPRMCGSAHERRCRPSLPNPRGSGVAGAGDGVSRWLFVQRAHLAIAADRATAAPNAAPNGKTRSRRPALCGLAPSVSRPSLRQCRLPGDAVDALREGLPRRRASPRLASVFRSRPFARLWPVATCSRPRMRRSSSTSSRVTDDAGMHRTAGERACRSPPLSGQHRASSRKPLGLLALTSRKAAPGITSSARGGPVGARPSPRSRARAPARLPALAAARGDAPRRPARPGGPAPVPLRLFVLAPRSREFGISLAARISGAPDVCRRPLLPSAAPPPPVRLRLLAHLLAHRPPARVVYLRAIFFLRPLRRLRLSWSLWRLFRRARLVRVVRRFCPAPPALVRRRLALPRFAGSAWLPGWRPLLAPPRPTLPSGAKSS